MVKQVKNSFKSKNVICTSKPLQLLHMYLFGPTKTTSLLGKRYAFDIVDDYSHYTWCYLVLAKMEFLFHLLNLCKKIQNEKGVTISISRSDHGAEFKNKEL